MTMYPVEASTAGNFSYITPPWTLSGTIDITNGVIADPDLHVNFMFPDVTFSTVRDVYNVFQTYPTSSFVPYYNEWVVQILGDAPNWRPQLGIVFVTPLSETLFNFHGATINGFGVDGGAAGGFSAGGVVNMGLIGTSSDFQFHFPVPASEIGTGWTSLFIMALMWGCYRHRRAMR